MITEQEKIRIIFGFKVKYLRQQNNLSYQQLANITGMSLSYLSDIEKGKKYPKIDKINDLAKAFGVDYDYLVSKKSSKKLQPIIELFDSEIFNIFPLESFGIDPGKLIELFVNAPIKVNAFISTILKISRNYELTNDIVYETALRSYQDMFNNYFGEIEDQTREFLKSFGSNLEIPFQKNQLEKLLHHYFDIGVDRTVLSKHLILKDMRSYYQASEKILHINSGFSNAQENFLIGRELAFQYLDLKERPYLTRPLEADSFEKLLHNFKASYFSVALLIPEEKLTVDLNRIFNLPSWDRSAFLALLTKYNVTPEMLMQRLTNILPKHFNISNLFFIRMLGNETLKNFKMTKELHLSKLHSPYANVLNEHYCRKWISINAIRNVHTSGRTLNSHGIYANAQISKYWKTENEYLCISLATKQTPPSRQISSVTVGLQVTEKLRKLIRFLNDPALATKVVNNTCERCSMPDCEARAFAPVVIEEKQKNGEIKRVLEHL